VVISRALLALAAAAAYLSACSGESEPAAAPMLDGGTVDAPAAAAPSCIAPIAAPSWLAADLADHVAKLTGAAEIAQGMRLADRAAFEGRRAARTYLVDALAALGLETRLEDYAQGSNVVARLPAVVEGASEWVVVGAHYDTVVGSPGASDNATGVASVLAVARALKDLPCRTRGVIFVLFDEEEVGLRGSKAFAATLKAAGTPVVAVHTLDQVGWDSDRDGTFEVERPTPSLLAEYQAAATIVGATVVETNTSTSDHQSFRAVGFAAAGITEEYVNGDTTPNIHARADTAATVHAPYHALASRLLVYVVARELGARQSQ